MDYKDRIRRWRLILGEESHKEFESMGDFRGDILADEQYLMDQALDAIYNKEKMSRGLILSNLSLIKV